MSDKENKDPQGQDNQGSSEDYLKQYLEETDTNKIGSSSNNSDAFSNNVKGGPDPSRASDLQYFHFDAKEMPLGIFYPVGTKIMVRAAQVKEIQAYSMVDDNNFHDIVEKMNDMLASCVKVKYANGSIGTFADIKDGDRFYLIFLIRELTFQKGNSLVVNAECKMCNTENSIELKRECFVFWETDDDLEPYFDDGNKVFTFETMNESVFHLGVPCIGLQKSFTDYILDEYKNKKSPNMSFLKVIPFTISDRKSITPEGIKKKLADFQNMNSNDFQFLNAAVNKMKFGIKETRKKCSSCGEEVRTDMQFPGGASAIFVVHDAFDKYLKK